MTQLHSVDLMSTRNQMTLGLFLMLGMIMPAYIKDNKDVSKADKHFINLEVCH